GHARDGEVAQVGAINDVDQHAARAKPGSRGFGTGQRDEGKAGVGIVLAGYDSTGAFDEPSFRLGCFPLPEHDDRPAGDEVEERKRAHELTLSGLRTSGECKSSPSLPRGGLNS